MDIHTEGLNLNGMLPHHPTMLELLVERAETKHQLFILGVDLASISERVVDLEKEVANGTEIDGECRRAKDKRRHIRSDMQRVHRELMDVEIAIARAWGHPDPL